MSHRTAAAQSRPPSVLDSPLDGGDRKQQSSGGHGERGDGARATRPPHGAAPEGRDFWVDDKYASRCFMCTKRFHLLRRKHHCRFCGQIFCNDCLIVMKQGAHAKVCKPCHQNLLTRTAQRASAQTSQSAIFTARAPQQALLIDAMTAGIESSSSGSTIAGEAEDEEYILDEDDEEEDEEDVDESEQGGEEESEDGNSASMQGIAKEKRSQARMPADQGGANGNGGACDRVDTHAARQSMRALTRRHEETANELTVSYALNSIPVFNKDDITPWLSELKEHAVRKHTRPHIVPPPSWTKEYVPDARVRFTLESDYERLLISTAFDRNVIDEGRALMLPLMEERCTAHLQDRVRCLCQERGIDLKWVLPLCDIAWRVVSSTSVDRTPHFLSHVEVLSIPGDAVGDFEIINGISFSKQVTNRQMRTRIEFPRMLLLGGNVGVPPTTADYDLVEYSASYPGWLDKLYSRVRVWRPQIVLVERSMHHYMQDLVMQDGITLVTQVERKVMERIERSCGAVIVDDLAQISINEVHRQNPTGRCAQFVVRQLGNEPHLMEFKGLIRPTFTSVILRGPDEAELRECAEMLPQVFNTAYHLTLQTHYLIDFRAILARHVPRVADTSSPPVESLTMNMGVSFPVELENELREVRYSRDSIVMNCLSLPTEGDDAARGDVEENQRRQAGHLRVLAFYGDGDEPVAEFLADRIAEIESCKLFLHHNKKIIIRTHTEQREPRRATGADAGGEGTRPKAAALCATTCRACASAGCDPDSGALALSRHTLNMSFGAFLELSVYGNDGCCGRCGHGLHSDIVRSFIVFPTDQQQVTVSIAVEHLMLFDLAAPTMTMESPEQLSEVYFEMELKELEACVREFIARRQGDQVIEQQLMSYVSDITSMSMLREFRENVFRPMVDELLRELRAANVGTSRSSRVFDPKVWPPDLYYHAGLGLEFRLDEHASLIALALMAAANGGATSTGVLSPFDAALSLTGAHRRVGSMSIEATGLGGGAGQASLHTPPSRMTPVGLKGDSPLVQSLPPASLTTMSAQATCSDVTPSSPHHLSVPAEANPPSATLDTDVLDSMRSGMSTRSESPLPPTAELEATLTPSARCRLECSGSNSAVSLARIVAANREEMSDNSNSASLFGLAALLDTPRAVQQAPDTPFHSRSRLEGRSPGSSTGAGHAPLSGAPEGVAEATADQTMEQIFMSATDRAATTLVSESFTMHNVDEAIDVLLGKSSPTRSGATAGATTARGKRPAAMRDTFAKFHTEIVLSEDGSKLLLKVESLFPNQFAALRYLYTEGDPEAIILSLARCQTFNPGAGKSGAGFFSTCDDRFVLKAVKKEELSHFVRHFHKGYFAHMANMYLARQQGALPAEEEKRYSLPFGGSPSDGPFGMYMRTHPADSATGGPLTSFLVKIFGVYTITMKRQGLFNGDVKHYILMENLFYKREKTVIYDLKGSQRNRMADANNVQLDENLVHRTRQGYYFFCNEEHKSWLDATLSADAQLLCNSRIMDYSLIAGVNEVDGTITLGVIDYLRPYTLDKATESVLKSAKASVEAALTGVATVEDPTIIEPPNYKDRFLKWMGNYFCAVPGKTSLFKRYKRNAERRRVIK